MNIRVYSYWGNCTNANTNNILKPFYSNIQIFESTCSSQYFIFPHAFLKSTDLGFQNTIQWMHIQISVSFFQIQSHLLQLFSLKADIIHQDLYQKNRGIRFSYSIGRIVIRFTIRGREISLHKYSNKQKSTKKNYTKDFNKEGKPWFQNQETILWHIKEYNVHYDQNSR